MTFLGGSLSSVGSPEIEPTKLPLNAQDIVVCIVVCKFQCIVLVHTEVKADVRTRRLQRSLSELSAAGVQVACCKRPSCLELGICSRFREQGLKHPMYGASMGCTGNRKHRSVFQQSILGRILTPSASFTCASWFLVSRFPLVLAVQHGRTHRGPHKSLQTLIRCQRSGQS